VARLGAGVDRSPAPGVRSALRNVLDALRSPRRVALAPANQTNEVGRHCSCPATAPGSRPSPNPPTTSTTTRFWTRSAPSTVKPGRSRHRWRSDHVGFALVLCESPVKHASNKW